MAFTKKNKRNITFFIVAVLSIFLCVEIPASVCSAERKIMFKASSCQDNKTTNKKFSAVNSLLEKVLNGKKTESIKQKLPLKPGTLLGKNNINQNNTSQSNSSQNNNSLLSSYEQEAVNLLNADRKAHGLPPLEVNMELVRLARAYAQDMIDRDFFDHKNPEGLSPFDRMKNAGISYRWAGENIAINYSVAAAQKAFMSSAGHKANILSTNFTQVGIGVKRNSDGSFYVVQEFIGL